MKLPRHWVRYLSIVVVLLLLGSCAFAFLHLGDWLVVQDPLQQAHAIVVLSGHLPDRALEAARIYAANFSAEVWVSQRVSPAPELAKMNIAFVGEDFYNEKVLMAQGVPADAIRILMDPAANTEAGSRRDRTRMPS